MSGKPCQLDDAVGLNGALLVDAVGLSWVASVKADRALLSSVMVVWAFCNVKPWVIRATIRLVRFSWSVVVVCSRAFTIFSSWAIRVWGSKGISFVKRAW